MRQVEHRRRHPLGPRRARPLLSSQQGARRRHLRRLGRRRSPGDGRGNPHLRERRRERPSGVRIVRRDRDHPPDLPRRRERILHQQGPVPPEGHRRTVPRHGRRRPRIRHHRPGEGRRDRRCPAGRDAHDHRGGRGGRQVPGPAERGGAEDGEHPPEPRPREGHPRRGPAPDRGARTAGPEGGAVQGVPVGTEGSRSSRRLPEASRDDPRVRRGAGGVGRHRRRASLCAFRPGADGRRPRRGAGDAGGAGTAAVRPAGRARPTEGGSGASRGGVGRASRTGGTAPPDGPGGGSGDRLPRIGDRGARRADRGGGRGSRPAGRGAFPGPGLLGEGKRLVGGGARRAPPRPGRGRARQVRPDRARVPALRRAVRRRSVVAADRGGGTIHGPSFGPDLRGGRRGGKGFARPRRGVRRRDRGAGGPRGRGAVLGEHGGGPRRRERDARRIGRGGPARRERASVRRIATSHPFRAPGADGLGLLGGSGRSPALPRRRGLRYGRSRDLRRDGRDDRDRCRLREGGRGGPRRADAVGGGPRPRRGTLRDPLSQGVPGGAGSVHPGGASDPERGTGVPRGGGRRRAAHRDRLGAPRSAAICSGACSGERSWSGPSTPRSGCGTATACGTPT